MRHCFYYMLSFVFSTALLLNAAQSCCSFSFTRFSRVAYGGNSYLLSTGPRLPPPRVWGRASGFAGGQFVAMRSGDLLGLKNIIRITGVVSNENSKTCLIWTTQLCAVAMLDHEQARRIHDFLNCGCLTCTGKLYIKIALAPAAHAIGYELPSRLKRCSLK